MTAEEPLKLTPFAARVVRRLLDSSLTWREITEAFSGPDHQRGTIEIEPAVAARRSVAVPNPPDNS
ncbi:MAG: hypothetical protein ACYTE6_03330 [Planctomycetota bacterium]|jgi:hypothetical protein